MPTDEERPFDAPLSDADIGHIEARFDAGDLGPAVAHLYADRLIRELRKMRAKMRFYESTAPPSADRFRRLMFNEPTPTPRPREGTWLAGYLREFSTLEDSYATFHTHGFGDHIGDIQYGARTIEAKIKLLLDLDTPMNISALYEAGRARKPQLLKVVGPVGPSGMPIIDGEVVQDQQQPPPPPRSIAPGAQVLLLDDGGGEDGDG